MGRFAEFSQFFLGAGIVTRGVFAACAPRDTPALVPATWNGQSYGCKCYLGDACWPNADSWSKLNATVDGNLVVHVPPEAVCHNTFDGPLGSIKTYDAAACAKLTAIYPDEQWS